jgi:hypothetical protein
MKYRRLKLADRPNGLAEGELIEGAFELPADVRRSAALTVCDRAAGADDARLLLEACGLASYEHGKSRTYHFGRRP